MQQYIDVNDKGGTVSALLSDEDVGDEGRMGGRTFVGGRTLLNVRTAASMTFADKTGPGPGPRAKTTVDAAVLGGEDIGFLTAFCFILYVILFSTLSQLTRVFFSLSWFLRLSPLFCQRYCCCCC